MKTMRKGFETLEVRFMRFMQEVRACEEFVNLTYGEPFQPTPQIIKDKAIEALLDNQTKYPLATGLPELKQAIAQQYKLRYDVNYEANDVVVTTGSTQSLAFVLLALLDEGDEVIAPSPCFILYEPMVRIAHGSFVSMDTGDLDFQITEERLEASITDKTKAIILTSPNNPTGVSLTKESLDIVARSAQRHGYFVICDDIYDQIVFDNVPNMITYQDIRKQVIILQSFSKSYSMTGWRLGWILADSSLSGIFGQMATIMQSGVSTFTQHAGLAALEYDNTELLMTFEKHAQAVSAHLDRMKLPYVKPSGAFYVYPNISEFGLSSWDFCYRLLHEYHVAVIPGISFADNSDMFIRISYVSDLATLDEGMRGLEQFVNDLRKEKPSE